VAGVIAGAMVALFSQVFLAVVAVVVIAAFSFVGYQTSRRRSGALFPMAFVGTAASVLALGTINNWEQTGPASSTSTTWAAIGLGVVAFVLGSTLSLMAISSSESGFKFLQLSSNESFSLRQRKALRFADGCLLAISLLNLVTGEVIIFSSEISASRFSGNYGLLGRAWPIVFGALQASFLLHAFLLSRRRRPEDFIFCMLISTVFVATAARSFVFVALAAVAIAVLETRRPRLWLVIVVLVCGLTLAGAAGYVRNSTEFGAQTIDDSLVEREFPTGILGLTLSNLSTGPWVLSKALHDVPDQVPFQRGMFFLRDGLNFVDSSFTRSDVWVAETILEREPLANIGYPPTVIGGLYLDFGFAGIAIGMFAAGALTQWLYKLARHRGILGHLQYSLWCAYLLTSVYSYFSLKPSFFVSILLLEVLIRIERRFQVAASTTLEVSGAREPT
jgi:oligosaccharide repeat unit polymerase